VIEPFRRRAQRVSPGKYGSGNGRHGLTAAIIEGMRRRQQGRCLICLEPLPPVPAVDHDHAMAEAHGHDRYRGCPRCVRGLLCTACNSMIGFARDDPDRLQAAITYLRAWRARHG